MIGAIAAKIGARKLEGVKWRNEERVDAQCKCRQQCEPEIGSRVMVWEWVKPSEGRRSKLENNTRRWHRENSASWVIRR